VHRGEVDGAPSIAGEGSGRHRGLLTRRPNGSCLRALMEKHGFKPYPPEWWHFTLRDEPYPETFFDFEIE